ncbi:hypothetical protein ABZV14_40490 [Streptosporangium canum]|uniref:hypothetical protein n=1 Tax=Streptosporangium canum TaxID=324952 RepID=UPI0033AF6BDF
MVGGGRPARDRHFIAERIGYENASGIRLFAHLWSIGVEWHLDVAWPLITVLAGRGAGPVTHHALDVRPAR